MKQEERLFDLLGRLPDELLAQAEPPRKRRRWLAPVAAAACLLAAVGIGAGLWGGSRQTDTADVPGTPNVGHAETTETDAIHGPELDWPIPEGDLVLSSALYFAHVPVGTRTAEYHQVEVPGALPEAQRPRYVGENYWENWYLPEDNRGLQYLLRLDEDGSYSLWKFACFTEEGYPYADVLEQVYSVTGPEDIVSVTVKPGNMDNTDAGQALQQEIGVWTMTSREDIETFYQAIVSMTCLGVDRWDLIERGDQGDGEGGLLYAVQTNRYLTVETADGVVFDTLKYSAAGGQFYEYSGIAYAPLLESEAEKLNALFQIDVT